MKQLGILLALVFATGSLAACTRGGKETEGQGGQTKGGSSQQQTQPGEEQRTGFPSTNATGGAQGSQQQTQPGEEQRTAYPGASGGGGAGGSQQQQQQQSPGIGSGQGSGGSQAYPGSNQ